MKVSLKTREQIAYELGISTQTLRRWLKKENIELKNRLISIDDQILIYQSLGFSCLAHRLIQSLNVDIHAMIA